MKVSLTTSSSRGIIQNPEELTKSETLFYKNAWGHHCRGDCDPFDSFGHLGDVINCEKFHVNQRGVLNLVCQNGGLLGEQYGLTKLASATVQLC